jgi:hypothetical protein
MIGCHLSSQYETRRPIFYCAFPQNSANAGLKLELVALESVSKVRKVTQPPSYIYPEDPVLPRTYMPFFEGLRG